jgi:acyl carrier protein
MMNVVVNSEFKKELKDIICEIIEVEDFQDDQSFAEMGIDSMMVLEVVAEIENKFSIKIPDEEIGNYFQSFDSIVNTTLKIMSDKN